MRAAKALGVEMLTLHASGGPRMLEAAVDARGGDANPLLLGVTVLTSLDHADLTRLGQQDPLRLVVERLAAMVHRCGCDGVVASAHEAAAVKELCGQDFLVVTPGIRHGDAAVDDQARVATVDAAVAAGADYLVVGRPILRATDPAQAAAEIQKQIESAYVRDQ